MLPLLGSLSTAVNSSATQPLADLPNCFPSGSNLLQEAPFNMPVDLTDILPSSPAAPERPPLPCINDDESRGAPSTTAPEEDEEDDLNIKDASNTGNNDDKTNGKSSTPSSDDDEDDTLNSDDDEGKGTGSLASSDRNEDGTSNSGDDDDKVKGGRSTSLADMDDDGNESGTSSADEASTPSKRVSPLPWTTSDAQRQQTSKKRRRRPGASVPYLSDSDNDNLPTNKLVQGGKSSSDPIDVDFYASLWEPSSSRHYVCHFFCFHLCFDLT